MNTMYFDNAATTKIDDRVFKAMIPYLTTEYGNPSSVYRLGKITKNAIEESRKKVAKVLNCLPSEIYFTSCGSESDNFAVKGIAYANKDKGNHIITSKIEHSAILDTCSSLEKMGFEITYIDVDENGIINVEQLKNSIKDTTILISVMFANNEVGTIQPIREISTIAKEHNIYFHTDAVQAIGNIKIDVKDLNVDLLSLSGHKFYAPKGIGALYIRRGVKFDKFINGGHQERNKRAGTENIAGIVGIGEAIEIAYQDIDDYNKKLKEFRDYYFEKIEKRIPNIKINGDREKRLPGNANVSFINIKGEDLLFRLDLKGICASSGSACTAGSLLPSHVLLAMGIEPQIAISSLRVTFGKHNTKEDVDFLIDSIEEIVKELRANN